MLVWNRPNTAEDRCPCPSWLEHWKQYSGARPEQIRCSVAGCNEKATVGAHVTKIPLGPSTYIIPFCAAHNSQRTPLNVNSEMEFVGASKRERCG